MAVVVGREIAVDAKRSCCFVAVAKCCIVVVAVDVENVAVCVEIVVAVVAEIVGVAVEIVVVGRKVQAVVVVVVVVDSNSSPSSAAESDINITTILNDSITKYHNNKHEHCHNDIRKKNKYKKTLKITIA